MTHLRPPSRPPFVLTEGNRSFATSKDVIAFFGKRHNNFFWDIKGLILDSAKVCGRNFAQTLETVPMPNGGVRPLRTTRWTGAASRFWLHGRGRSRSRSSTWLTQKRLGAYMALQRHLGHFIANSRNRMGQFSCRPAAFAPNSIPNL